MTIILLLATLAVTGILADQPRTQPMWMRIAAVLCLIAAPFAFAMALYSWGPVLRLRKIRKVLREYPWEHRASVRPCNDVKDVMALPVRLKADADGAWSKTMRAVNPLRRKRWTGEMEESAWFAGDPEFGGVIAVPGGSEFMTLERGSRTPLEEYREIVRDKNRMARARRAGVGALSLGPPT
ncbi:hypothetical protein J7E96_20740 [Streptomyces sp. ISL-96]|uniref:hypothetical protein n=1 Tax=unclassified Streptomyces TaxID=2593676 RepID=UPI001BE8ED48|nr:MULTISPECIES: hypothetical protein [unclassified Streptomyces]MBT2397840.1 hypothetical protein [Streptomyces sp. ISL-100]MBT2490898.1 hypothetical protein [Streptomyces sp. ISL-96]